MQSLYLLPCSPFKRASAVLCPGVSSYPAPHVCVGRLGLHPMFMDWMAGVPKMSTWRGGRLGPFTFLLNVCINFKEQHVKGRGSALMPVDSGCLEGTQENTQHGFLKWLLSLLPKAGELRADRKISGVCTLRLQTTKLPRHFFIPFFWDQAMKEKKNPNKQKCRSFKSQVVRLNKNEVEKHLSSSLKCVLIKRPVIPTREIPIFLFW